MGFCTRRYFFLSICLLQTLSVVQRQVFDFLGFLWIPILANFFEVIFIIFGFFGAYQYRPKYIVAYLLWHLFWLAWNIFLICLYLDVAGLDHKTNKVLKLDMNSFSWWQKYGPGCKIVLSSGEEKIDNCWVSYVHVEIFQAGLQCFLAFFGSIIGTCLSRMFLEEDDTFNYEKPDGTANYLLHPMYVSTDNLRYNDQKYINVNVKRDKNHHNSNRRKSKVFADTVRVPSNRNSYNEFSEHIYNAQMQPKSLRASVASFSS